MPIPSTSPRRRSSRRPLTTLLALSSLPLMVSLGCGDNVTKNYVTNEYGEAGADSVDNPPIAGKGGTSNNRGGASGSGAGPSTSEGGSGGESGAGTEVVSPYPGAPTADTEVADQTIDVFGAIGNRYWFGVSDEQLERMNALAGGGGWNPWGDIYQPGASGVGNYADHLWVTTAGPDPKTADYGQVQVKIVGQSTMRQWTTTTIPNLNVDFDEFVNDQRIDVFEHLRFNNGLVGSIFRERITLELYKLLGYQAPRANYAWVSSNVWGSDVAVPYILVERYKPTFCEHWKEEIGGGCANIWEFVGDFGQNYGYPGEDVPSVFDDPNICEFDECDDTHGRELETAIRETPQGPGYKAALSGLIHWPSFHAFQCLSWILATGDDALHNTNNVVVMERGDGLFQYLPYSVDISLGQDWYSTVPLPGNNSVSRGCQSDPVCWDDTIATCEQLIADFAELDPKALLDGVYQQLTDEGMIRPGDDGRYQSLSDWFDSRLVNLPIELEQNRDMPLCPYDMVDCGGYCDYPWNCGNNCQPPPPPPPVMGAGGAGGDAAVGAGGADPIGQGGGGGIICEPIEYYGL